MNRIEREKHTVSLMIRLYCRKKEGNKNLCSECRKLEEYAHKRRMMLYSPIEAIRHMTDIFR